jgi:hypothetical protein
MARDFSVDCMFFSKVDAAYATETLYVQEEGY